MKLFNEWLKRISKILLAGMPVLLFGCASVPQTPPTIQYLYDTSTQDTHQLAGLNIKYDQGALRSPRNRMQIKYYIDGREVGSHRYGGPPFETLVQLPSGTHQLIVQDLDSGFPRGKLVYSFSLEGGQVGLVQYDNSSCYDISNVKSYTLIESVRGEVIGNKCR